MRSKMRRFTDKQREAIRQAAQDAMRRGGLNEHYDAVDLASDTGNYFWTGLNDRQTRVALRYIASVSG